MPPIVVPHVVRYSVFGTINDQPWANCWDCMIPEGRPAASAKITAMAEKLLDAYYGFRTSLSNKWSLVGVRWVDLDSLGGEVGELLDTAANTFPASGSGSAHYAMPGNVAILIRKNVTGGRSARKGRVFLPGMLNDNNLSTNGNLIDASTLASLQTQATAVLTALNSTLSGVVCAGHVVHQPAGGGQTSDPITSVTVQQRLATLRGRLRD